MHRGVSYPLRPGECVGVTFKQPKHSDGIIEADFIIATVDVDNYYLAFVPSFHQWKDFVSVDDAPDSRHILSPDCHDPDLRFTRLNPSAFRLPTNSTTL